METAYDASGIPIDVPQKLLKIKQSWYPSGALNSYGLYHDSVHFHCCANIADNHGESLVILEGLSHKQAKSMLREKFPEIMLEDGNEIPVEWGSTFEHFMPDLIYIHNVEWYNSNDPIKKAKSWKSVEFTISKDGERAVENKRAKGYDIVLAIQISDGSFHGDWDEVKCLDENDFVNLRCIITKCRPFLISKGETEDVVGDDSVPDPLGVLEHKAGNVLDKKTFELLLNVGQKDPERIDDHIVFEKLWGNTGEEAYVKSIFPIQFEGTRKQIRLEKVRFITVVRFGKNKMTKGMERTKENMIGVCMTLQDEIRTYQMTMKHGDEWMVFKKAQSLHSEKVFWKRRKSKLREKMQLRKEEEEMAQKIAEANGQSYEPIKSMPYEKGTLKHGSTDIIDLSFTHLVETSDTGIKLLPKENREHIEDQWASTASEDVEAWLNSTNAGHKIACFSELAGILYKNSNVYDKRECKRDKIDQVLIHKVGMGNIHYGFMVRSETHIKTNDEDGNFDVLCIYFSKHILADTGDYFIWDVEVEFVDGTKDNMFMYVKSSSISGQKLSYIHCARPRVGAIFKDAETLLFKIKTAGPYWEKAQEMYLKGERWEDIQQFIKREKTLKWMREGERDPEQDERTFENINLLNVKSDKPMVKYMLFIPFMRAALEAHLVFLFWKMVVGGRYTESAGQIGAILCRAAEAKKLGWDCRLRDVAEFKKKLYDEVRCPISQYMAENAISMWLQKSFTNEDWFSDNDKEPRGKSHGEYNVEFKWDISRTITTKLSKRDEPVVPQNAFVFEGTEGLDNIDMIT